MKDEKVIRTIQELIEVFGEPNVNDDNLRRALKEIEEGKILIIRVENKKDEELKKGDRMPFKIERKSRGEFKHEITTLLKKEFKENDNIDYLIDIMIELCERYQEYLIKQLNEYILQHLREYHK